MFRILMPVAVLFVLLHSTPAAFACEFQGGTLMHGDWSYCEVPESVPLGCPAHLLAMENRPITATVQRNGVEVNVVAAVTGPIVIAQVATKSFDCSCAAIFEPVPYQQATIALMDVAVGDVVTLPSGDKLIEPPGPCPLAQWPTEFRENVACDLCGPQPDALDPHGQPGQPHFGGCASHAGNGGLGGVMVMALALVLLRQRRQRRQRR